MQARFSLNKIFSKPTILLLIILCEGFVSIAVEILTIRQLLPVAGSSVIVTSLIIGIFLLFLALGYRKGGRIEKNLVKVLRFNFIISALWLGIGLSYIFITSFFSLAEKIVGSHIINQLIFYLLLIIAPLIYILGQTVPITMNLSKEKKSIGAIGGNILGLSTVGSFLGATITALLFVQYFGVAWTIIINSCILLILVLILSQESKLFFINIFLSAIIIVIIYTLNAIVEQSIFIQTTNYANYQLLQSPKYHLKFNEKIFVSNNSLSSFIDAEKKGFPYIELIKKIIFDDLQFRNKNILVLGAGGFTFSAEKIYDNNVTYVDVDSQINQIVIPKFLDHFAGNFIADDGRHFIRSTQTKFDAIILDAFSNFRSIPSFLLTYEFMKEVEAKLNENGVMIINIIGRATLSDPYSKRIDNTIHTAFRSCMSTPLKNADEITNIIYVCQKNKEQSDRTIYTDNLNTSTTDAFGW